MDMLYQILFFVFFRPFNLLLYLLPLKIYDKYKYETRAI
ncbi:MAG: hypothetical protein JWM14_1908 [Chitinophagaceae bacterium]|nr:hypothetical protein [Chitinophagaceae bacterium]